MAGRYLTDASDAPDGPDAQRTPRTTAYGIRACAQANAMVWGDVRYRPACAAWGYAAPSVTVRDATKTDVSPL